MLHVELPRKKRLLPSLLFSFLALAAALFLFVFSIRAMQDRTGENQLSTLSSAIKRASVQCYAIEGRYPPSVEYLEEHYGIVIDHEQYQVFYDGWASNIMPDITVVPREPSGRKGTDH